MRYKYGYCKFGRISLYRRVLLKNLVIVLIEYNKIEIGIYKVKELCSYIEKLMIVVCVGDFNVYCYVFVYL